MSLTETLKNLTLAEILTQYPQSESILQKHGLLLYARTETAKRENLVASALVHGLDIETLVKALTQAVEE